MNGTISQGGRKGVMTVKRHGECFGGMEIFHDLDWSDYTGVYICQDLKWVHFVSYYTYYTSVKWPYKENQNQWVEGKGKHNNTTLNFLVAQKKTKKKEIY